MGARVLAAADAAEVDRAADPAVAGDARVVLGRAAVAVGVVPARARL